MVCEWWNIYNRGEYLQLYKDGWYNHNQGGIHFETYIETREIKNKEFPICVHAEGTVLHKRDSLRIAGLGRCSYQKLERL